MTASQTRDASGKEGISGRIPLAGVVVAEGIPLGYCWGSEGIFSGYRVVRLRGPGSTRWCVHEPRCAARRAPLGARRPVSGPAGGRCRESAHSVRPAAGRDIRHVMRGASPGAPQAAGRRITSRMSECAVVRDRPLSFPRPSPGCASLLCFGDSLCIS